MFTSERPRPQQSGATLLEDMQAFKELPDWLTVIVKPDLVSAALVDSVPEFVSGELQLINCEIRRVRIKNDHWTALYDLTAQRMHSGQQQVAQLQGTLLSPEQGEPMRPTNTAAFGDESWYWYVPSLRLVLTTKPPELALPAISHLTDPVEARGLLERGMSAAPNYATLHIQQCVPTVVRFKPGSRCTIHYRLHYQDELAASEKWPEVVIAKTYKGNTGQNTYLGMRALWESPLARGEIVRIAEPLAFLPELKTLVQGSIDHEWTLKDMIRSALRAGTATALSELTTIMRQTARGLAALHRSGVRHGEVISWEDEFADLREVVDQLSLAIPSLAGPALPLLSWLEACAKEHPADPLAPAHGSFRPGQVLLGQNTIGFIDFDKFGQAEPAHDIALFLSSAKNIGLSEPHEEESNDDDVSLDPAERLARLMQLDALCAAFLAEYEQVNPVSRQRVMLWETRELLSLVLTCWTKIKPVRLNNTLLMLDRHLRANAF